MKGGMRRGHLQDGTLPNQNWGVGAKAFWSKGRGWRLVPPGRGATRGAAELGCDLPSWQGAEG